MRRILILLATVTATVLATVLPATAITTGDENVGSFYNQGYLGSHDVFAGWARAEDNIPHQNELNLRADIGSIADGYCVQVAFDWIRAQGHYDPRIVRNCDPNSIRRTPLDYVEELSCGVTPCTLHAHSVQFAVYAQVDGSLYNKQCWMEPGINRTCGEWNPSDAPNCSRVWGRHRDGSNWYRSGGDPTNCNS